MDKCEYGHIRGEDCDGNCMDDCPGECRELNEEFVREADRQRWNPSVEYIYITNLERNKRF